MEKNYNEHLTDFMFEVSSKLGGGLPNDYFNKEDFIKLENIFKRIYESGDLKPSNYLQDKELCEFLNSKMD